MNPWALLNREEATDPESLMQMIAEMQGGRAPATVRPVPKDSGLTNEESQKTTINRLRIENVPTYAAPKTIVDLSNAIRQLPGIVSQKEQIDRLKSAIMAQLQDRSGGIDYASPASYLANYFSGGKAKYIAPRQNVKAQLLDQLIKVQDKELAVEKTIADYFRAAKGGSVQLKDGTTIIDASGSKAEDPAMSGRKSGTGGPKPTEAQKAVDRAFGKDYADWVAGGGYSSTKKQIQQLRDVLSEMKKTDSATGPVIGVMPKGLRDIVAPKSGDIEDRIRNVVQQNLRRILGAQFAKEEGERVMKSYFNPRLDEKENADRLSLLIKEMENAAQARAKAAEYYEKNDTLMGFKGDVNPSSFFSLLGASGAPPVGLTPEQKARKEELLRKARGE